MHLVSGHLRSMNWMRVALATTVVVFAVAGCAGNGGAARQGNGQQRNSADGKDLATESDQTDFDRRAKVRLELAAAYFGRGQSTDALDEVKQSLVARPENPAAYGLRGLIYASLGDAATADESFRHALALAPHDGELMHNYGWFLCQQKRFSEADAQFLQAMAQPNYVSQSRTQLAQGVCQARAGHLSDAEHTLSHAYELDPASPVIAVNLSQVLYRNAQYDRARFYIRRVNTRPELVNAQTLWLAAQIEHKLGQDDQVKDMGVQLESKFPQAPETLLFQKGRFDE